MALGFPCTGECGCFTDRLIEGIEPGSKVAFCVWCEDGVPCPNGGKPLPAEVNARAPKPSASTKFDSSFLDRRMEEHRQRVENVPPARKEKVMPRGIKICPCGSGEQIGCRALGCTQCKTGNTANSVRGSRVRKQKTDGNRVSLSVSERMLDRLLCALPLDEKARLLSEAFD